MHRSNWAIVALAGALVACHHDDSMMGEDQGIVGDLGDDSGSAGVFDVQPSALQTLSVTRGMTSPTVAYTATLDGQPALVSWTVDRGDVGTVAAGPSSAATVAPTGNTGGMLTVRARLGATTLTRQIFVQLSGGTQNGANTSNLDEMKQIPADVPSLSNGGGTGGVGGEGLGGPVSDPAVVTALGAPTSDGTAQNLRLLYPYDATIWPRGMLAPLLMWSWSQGDADAIQIELSTTSGSFSWRGTFNKPAILSQPGTPSGGKFIRHPIPQDVWNIATNTAGGATPSGVPDKLTVKLTVAKSGQAYGPIAQTYLVAPARLTGTVYYNSYGTKLVKNWAGTHDSANHPIGAAILGVRSGDTGPHLVVGKDSPLGVDGLPTDNTGCRVCHVVSSRGRWLIAQAEAGGNKQSYIYDLNAPDPQAGATYMSHDGSFAWSAMVSDGSYALTNTIDPSSSNDAISQSTSGFWAFGAPAGSAIAAQTLVGLPGGVAAGYPSYSPDDKLIAYIDVTGRTTDIKDSPLMLASYDSTAHSFSAPQQLYAPPSGMRVGYPAFLPDSSGIVFEHEVRAGGDTLLVTRSGARSELWWLKPGATPMPVRLQIANGMSASGSYLPTGGSQHGAGNTGGEVGYDDTTLDYEPTVLPIVSGGFAWIVFTSRRLYGNQLTTDPWASDPQTYNLQQVAEAPTKKLWVAAIDLNAPAGSDPSHPAFYLPAQEITAGNSRGFWVLDPCKGDGMSCQSGDQCCGGFCQPDPANPTSGSLICTNTSSCAGVQEKCATPADCCDTSNNCTNGFCAASQIL